MWRFKVNLERLDFARILISMELLDTINVVENILIDDKHYSIKIVEDIEPGFARDVCLDDKALDSTSEFSEQLGDFDNTEPIVEALVHELK